MFSARRADSVRENVYLLDPAKDRHDWCRLLAFPLHHSCPLPSPSRHQHKKIFSGMSGKTVLPERALPARADKSQLHPPTIQGAPQPRDPSLTGAR